jgi:hypothetical protein
MTDDAITVTFGHDRRLFRRALTGWWQSAVPPQSFVGRSIGWAVIWLAVGMLIMGLLAAGLTPGHIGAGIGGAGLLVGAFAYLQRTRMGRFHTEIARHWDKAGDTTARFDASGVVLTDAVSRRELQWNAIDAIRGARGVTVLRSGISMIAVPDAALPDGMRPKDFRARLDAWRTP